MRTWELPVNAIRHLGGHAKARDILTYIKSNTENYNQRNLHPDLCLVSVNCPGRINHSPNKNPRKTDSANKYDLLFKEGTGRDVTYHIYDPQKHGIWEISATTADSKTAFRVAQLNESFPDEKLAEAQKILEQNGAFDPASITDARQRIATAVVARRGQQAFRQALLLAYGNKCAITGCGVAAVLEAAHIFPYLGPKTNHTSNGLLLRADIHTLFDLGLLNIHPTELTVELSEDMKNSEYSQLNGTHLRLPPIINEQPNQNALEDRYKSNTKTPQR